MAPGYLAKWERGQAHLPILYIIVFLLPMVDKSRLGEVAREGKKLHSSAGGHTLWT